MIEKLKINGWGGEHDETGAHITTESGEYRASTCDVHSFVKVSRGPEEWKAYHENAYRIVASYNACRHLTLDQLKEIEDGELHVSE